MKILKLVEKIILLCQAVDTVRSYIYFLRSRLPPALLGRRLGYDLRGCATSKR